jgi:hypothetical protein
MGKRFDDLSKAFASGVSRRQALVGALGGVGAAVAATVIPGRKAALADDNAARQCAFFCAQYCKAQAVAINGTASILYVQYCTEQCVAEASMGQGVCFSISGAPLYKRGTYWCQTTADCDRKFPNKDLMCCNNRCCKEDLCFSLFFSQYSNSDFFTNGLEPYFIPGDGKAFDVCLGCPNTV